VLSTENKLAELASQIRYQDSQATNGAVVAIARKIEVGKLLMEARKLFSHRGGEFGAWAQREFGWRRAHVARHLRLARNGSRVIQMANGDVSLRGALRLIGGEREKGEHEEKYVLVGVLDGPPGEVPAAELVNHVKEWRVRKA